MVENASEKFELHGRCEANPILYMVEVEIVWVWFWVWLCGLDEWLDPLKPFLIPRCPFGVEMERPLLSVPACWAIQDGAVRALRVQLNVIISAPEIRFLSILFNQGQFKQGQENPFVPPSVRHGI